MRAELLPAALLAGCAFSGEVAPGTAGDVLDNLLEDHLASGALRLGSGGATAVADDGTAAVLVPEAEGGAALWVFGAGSPRATPLPGFSATRTLLGRAGDTWVVWACPSTVHLVRDGDREADPRPAPAGMCPDALGGAADGDLLAASFAFDEDGLAAAVTVDRLSTRDLAREGADRVPRGSADRVLRLGDDGDGPWLLGSGTDLGTLVWSGPSGLAELQESHVRVAARGGASWRLAFANDPALYRWTPDSGAFDVLDRLEGEPWTEELAGSLDGFLGLRTTTVAGTAVVTEAWWVAPGADGWAQDPLAPSPCGDPLECATIAEWSPLAVLPAAGGRWTLWSGWSWLGPTALVAAPPGGP